MPFSSQAIKQFELWLKKIQCLNIRGLVLIAKQDKDLIYLLDNHALPQAFRLHLDCQDKLNSASDKVERFLGSENHYIHFDASQTFDANLFAAISGTLKGGGVLCLQIPELLLLKQIHKHQADAQFPQLNELIDKERATPSPLENSTTPCPLLERIVEAHFLNSSTAIAFKDQFLFPKVLLEVKSPSQTNRFSQQNELVEKIIQVTRGHANRPLVVTASRGRGKSAALGIAVSRLVKDKQTDILVTAPRLGNLNSFYRHLNISTQIDLKYAQQYKNQPYQKTIVTDNQSTIRYMPVDELIIEKPEANLLLIDEAAAIPVAQLNQLSQHYNRIVFTTTSDGYEGNGKGFEVRFKRQLLSYKPQTQFHTLTHPIRWANIDEMEPACFKALLLETKLATLDSSLKNDNLLAQLEFEIINPLHLNNHESDLKDLFSLLINAHYQTRPADLQTILSDPKLIICAARINKQIIAVALLNREGKLAPETAMALSEGKKRLKGELLPQSILINQGKASTDIEMAGTLAYYRIMRIAVHPQIQNRGIGGYLLKQIIQYAQSNNIDFVGASFAATADICRFWLDNQFVCTRFGSSKDSSSGSHSLEVLKALSEDAKTIEKQLANRFNRAFFYKLHSTLKDLELSLVSCVITHQVATSDQRIDQNIIAELRLFSESKRSFSAIEDILFNIFSNLIKTLSNDSWTKDEIDFLVDCLYIQSDFKMLALHFDLSGKKEALKHLRYLVSKLIKAADFHHFNHNLV